MAQERLRRSTTRAASPTPDGARLRPPGGDRIIDAWKLITPKPLHVRSTRPRRRALGTPLADHQELHIEMKGGSAIAEELVPREQQRVGIYRQTVDPAFLGRLAQRRRL